MQYKSNIAFIVLVLGLGVSLFFNFNKDDSQVKILEVDSRRKDSIITSYENKLKYYQREERIAIDSIRNMPDSVLYERSKRSRIGPPEIEYR